MKRAPQIPWYAEGGSGKLLDKVYYQRFGKTNVRKAPGSYNKVPTEKQAIVRARFIEAHRYAQTIINDPVLKAKYEQKLKGKRSVYHYAVSQFLKRNTNN